MVKRVDKAKSQDMKYREMPDIVVKVVCRYRAELFFKVSRKTKFSRLFNAWTDRMEATGGKKDEGKTAVSSKQMNGSAKSEAASTHTAGSTASSSMQFIFSHNGRTIDVDQTPEEQGVEDGDEILAVELMDLTEGPGLDDWVSGDMNHVRNRGEEVHDHRKNCQSLVVSDSRRIGQMIPKSGFPCFARSIN